MTTLSCLSLVVAGILTLFNGLRISLVFGACAIVAAFGWRLYAGDALRVIVADALLVVALLPIGWWAARYFGRIKDAAATHGVRPDLRQQETGSRGR